MRMRVHPSSFSTSSPLPRMSLLFTSPYVPLYHGWVCCSLPHSECFQVTVRWIFKTLMTTALYPGRGPGDSSTFPAILVKLYIAHAHASTSTAWRDFPGPVPQRVFSACWSRYSDPLLAISYRRSPTHLVFRHYNPVSQCSAVSDPLVSATENRPHIWTITSLIDCEQWRSDIFVRTWSTLLLWDSYRLYSQELFTLGYLSIPLWRTLHQSRCFYIHTVYIKQYQRKALSLSCFAIYQVRLREHNVCPRCMGWGGFVIILCITFALVLVLSLLGNFWVCGLFVTSATSASSASKS